LATAFSFSAKVERNLLIRFSKKKLSYECVHVPKGRSRPSSSSEAYTILGHGPVPRLPNRRSMPIPSWAGLKYLRNHFSVPRGTCDRR
jgi:hypothetical protein